MSTGSRAQAATDGREERGAARAVLLELENVVTNGRGAHFDALKEVLAEKDIELSPPLYSRYFVQSSLSGGMAALLRSVSKSRLSGDNILAEAYQRLKSRIIEGPAKLVPAAVKLVKVAGERSTKVGVLTALDVETARALAARLDIPDTERQVFSCHADGKSVPSPDSWLKLAKNIGVRPGRCTAIVTSSGSCKAALSAGMRAVAIPDRFTSCHDLGGADLVIESVSDLDLDDLFAAR